MNNLSINHPLIGTGRAGQLGGFNGWITGGLVRFNWVCKCFLAQFKKLVHIIFFVLFWAFFNPNQQIYVVGSTNLGFLALFFTIHIKPSYLLPF